MTIAVTATKHAIHDKLESQIKSAESKLDTVKAQAETVKAAVEIKAIRDLAAKGIEIHQKIQASKKSDDGKWEHTRKEIEATVANFEKSVKEIEAKVKAR